MNQPTWGDRLFGKRKVSSLELVGELLLGPFFIYTGITQSESIITFVFMLILGLGLLVKGVRDLRRGDT